MNHALHSSLLFNFHRYDKTFAADGDQLLLHRPTFREFAKIATE